MKSIDPKNLLATSSTENTFAKILVIATGSQVNPSDMGDLLFLHNRDGDFGGIAQVVEGHMAKQVEKNKGDVAKTVAELMSNSTGESWTTSKAQSFISEMSKVGVDTWAGLFAYLIENPSSEYGGKLDSNVKNYLSAYGITPGNGIDTTQLPTDVANKFSTPKGDDYYSTVGVRDINNNLIKEFKFDAPKMLFTGTANIFDFGDGEKTLAVTATDYSNIFDFGKDIFFLNFSAGDKVVIIDDSAYHPHAKMNQGSANFFNQINTLEDYIDPYDPSSGVWKDGDSLISVSTFKQWWGDVLSFPNNGVPVELASIADEYMRYVPGITYDLNLKGYDNFIDGRVIIVGTHPAQFDKDNFIFNDPGYIV